VIVDTLITNIAQLVTPSGSGALHGRAMRDVVITSDAAIAIAGGRVVWCGARRDWQGSASDEVDAKACAVVPGLVDPHTHAIWGGDRLADFDARATGATYESILAAGGGIRHTVMCTNAESDEALTALTLARVDRMLRAGATTIEIKSGYGFEWVHEQRLLGIIQTAASHVSAQVVPTMLFHLPPRDTGERELYLLAAANDWIPWIANEGAAAAIDVFVEREAFSVADADVLLRVARQCGLACKVHADQFSAIGGTELAIRHGALSVDHLEASGPEQIAALAGSSTVAVVLPGVSLHLGLRAAPGRALIDAGAAVAVGTDCNPGSSPLFSMGLALALAVRLNGLAAHEALSAATCNAAAALGLSHVGRIAPGYQADLLMLASGDWRDLPYTLGSNVVDRVFIAGHEVAE
jgi:imidazolonepropionase